MEQKEHVYYTYIVASRTHVLYIGVTSDIEVRLRQHKNGVFEGFSKKYHCDRLVWFERYGFIQTAISREKQLKRWSRVKKIWLIERENPAWVDLSEDWGKPIKLYEMSVEMEASTAGPSTPLLRNSARDDKD
jgi:putative endonuclease